MKKRSAYIDILKGLTMVLVVLGHCIQYGYKPEYLTSRIFFDNPIYKVIYSFHMPLFALISGYLFYFSVKKRSFVQAIQNRIMSLLVPIISFATLSFAVHYFGGGGYTENVVQLAKDYVHYVIGSLWYLWSILFCSMIIILVKYVFKDKMWLLAAVIPAFFVTPDMIIFNLKYMKYIYPYFVVGYLWNRQQGIHLLQRIRREYLLIGCILIYIMLWFGLEDNTFIYNSGFSILGKAKPIVQIYYDLYRWIIGLFGSVSVCLGILLLISWLEQSKLGTGLKAIGECSLGIYMLQGFAIQGVLVPWLQHVDHSLPGIVVIFESLVVLAVCVLLTRLIQKQKILNRLLFGGR